MGQHGTLGRTGGARRIDQYGQVFGHYGIQALPEFRFTVFGQCFATGHQRIEGHNHGVIECAQAFGIPHDHFLEGSCLLSEMQPFVQLFLILHEKEPGPAVVDDIMHLLPGIGGINSNGDTAGALDAQIGQHPLGAIVPDDGHTIPLFQTHLHQRQ